MRPPTRRACTIASAATQGRGGASIVDKHRALQVVSHTTGATESDPMMRSTPETPDPCSFFHCARPMPRCGAAARVSPLFVASPSTKDRG